MRQRRLAWVDRTRAAVKDRLTKEIGYWDHRAEDLKAQEKAGKANARLSPKEIDRHCQPDTDGAALLRQALTRLNLSPRAYHRILRVARSIADLAGAAELNTRHIAEAIQYRRLAKE